MNDPGLDEPIANASSEVQEQHSDRPDEAGPGVSEEEEERSFLLPARWWWASTAFPLIAGTFGPMANSFSICALVENWRVSIPPGGTEEHGKNIPDPRWLIAVNAVSLLLALIANLTLLLNMARRLSFKVAQPITIFGFWFASILLIALVAVANNDFHAAGVRNQALTQAYYYAIMAAGLYQIISYMMMVTIYGAIKGHYSKEFKLTISQRTLMLQTISFMVYLNLGALVYSRIESWEYLDAVYWADFTLLTIGIGDDYTPKTHLGRGLLFPFAIGGIVILGLVVGSIRSLVLERTAKKLSARMTEKTRRRVVKSIEKAERSEKSVTKIKGLSKETTKSLTLDPHDQEQSEKRRREAEFNAMRSVQHIAARERQWVSLIISGLAWLFLWLIGAVVFWKTEKNQDWSYFESIYFAYTTLLTIGYGDFEPQSNSGKPFFVFWSLLAVPTLTILISNMGDTVIKLIKDATIWLGEITVLPSDTGSVRRSVKVGLTKLSGGKIDVTGIREAEGVSEEPSGLIRMPHRQKEKHGLGEDQDIEAAQKIATDFANAEEMDEDEARRHGDKLAEDIHHYRHMLITEIRNVYGDVNAATPKKYTYEEWSYFLQLLGEDEGDRKYHRRAPTEPKKHEMSSAKPHDEGTVVAAEEKEQNLKEEAGQKHAHPEPGEKHDGSGIKRWSWMGNRSPLMGDKTEAEWILEKLFVRLEEELQQEKKLAAKMRRKKEEESGKMEKTPSWPLRPTEDRVLEKEKEQDGEKGEAGSGDSSRTLDDQSDDSLRPPSSQIRQSGLAGRELEGTEE